MAIKSPEQTQSLKRVTQVDLMKTKASKVLICSTLYSDTLQNISCFSMYKPLGLCGPCSESQAGVPALS